MTNYKPTPEQIFSTNRYQAIDALARKAGFDDDAFAYTEFSLVPFFELIVEECATLADVYGNENFAEVLRLYKKNIGNY